MFQKQCNEGIRKIVQRQYQLDSKLFYKQFYFQTKSKGYVIKV